jgi:hypothetical protein
LNFFFAVKKLIKNLGDRVTGVFPMFLIGADREGRKCVLKVEREGTIRALLQSAFSNHTNIATTKHLMNSNRTFLSSQNDVW